ncbi:hypothetical protein [Coriobacterium glomerans]|uniref:hypothetical protein n=1 Tax=Coriobacterium glomerans TaxID=33871 RepID=UPI00155AF43F|nr:hypothetical protein [Coriobacterium glomerans]
MVGRVLVCLLVAGAVAACALVPRNRNSLIVFGCTTIIPVRLFVRRLESLLGVGAGPLRRSIRIRAALLGFMASFMVLGFVVETITLFGPETIYAKRSAPTAEALEHGTAEPGRDGGSAARSGGSPRPRSGFTPEAARSAVLAVALDLMVPCLLVRGLAARDALAACAMLDRDLDPEGLLERTSRRPGLRRSRGALPWLHVAHHRALALALTGRAAEAASELDLLERAAASRASRLVRGTAAALGYHAASVALDAPRAERLWSALVSILPDDDARPATAVAAAVMRGRSALRALIAAGDWPRVAAEFARAARADPTPLDRLLALRGLAAASQRAGDAEAAARALREIAEGAGGLSGLAEEARSALAGQRRCFVGDGDYPDPSACPAPCARPACEADAEIAPVLGFGCFERALGSRSLRGCSAATDASSIGRAQRALRAAEALCFGVACIEWSADAVVLLAGRQGQGYAGPPAAPLLACVALALAAAVWLSRAYRGCMRALTRDCDPALLLERSEVIGGARRGQSGPGPLLALRAAALHWAGRDREADVTLGELCALRAVAASPTQRILAAFSQLRASLDLDDAPAAARALLALRELLAANRGSLDARRAATLMLESLSRAALAERAGTPDARLVRVRSELSEWGLSRFDEVSLRRAEALLLDELSGGFCERAAPDADAGALREEALRGWRFVAERGGTTPWAAEARARLAAPCAAAAGLSPYRRPLLLEVELEARSPRRAAPGRSPRSRRRRARRIGCSVCLVVLTMLLVPMVGTPIMASVDATDLLIPTGIGITRGDRGRQQTDQGHERTYATPSEALRATGLLCEASFVSDPLLVRENDSQASVLYFISPDREGKTLVFAVARMRRRDGRYAAPTEAPSFSCVDTAMDKRYRFPTPEAKAGYDIEKSFIDNDPDPACGLQWFGASKDPRVGEMTVLGRRPDGVVSCTYKKATYYCWYYDDLDVIGALKARSDFHFDRFAVRRIMKDLDITFPGGDGATRGEGGSS